MRNFIVLVAFNMLIFSLLAQSENSKLERFAKNLNTENTEELGLYFFGLNNYGLIFKRGENNSFKRYRTGAFTGKGKIFEFGDDDQKNYEQRFSLSYHWGREKRVPVNQNLSFVYGHEYKLAASYYYRNSENIGSSVTSKNKLSIYTFTPGIVGVIGFHYGINQNFVLAAELLPSFSLPISYNSTKSETLDVDGNSLNSKEENNFTFEYDAYASLYNAMVSICYRF